MSMYILMADSQCCTAETNWYEIIIQLKIFLKITTSRWKAMTKVTVTMVSSH